MNTILDILQYFVTITIELIVLFMLISAIVEFVFMYVSEDKLRKYLSSKGIWGNIMAVLFGAVTPFCACSTVPMTLGLLRAGVPFGAVMSFLISSPLIDPLVFTLLVAFMGWKVAIAFFILTSVFSVFFGILLEKIGWKNQVKDVRIKQGCCHTEEINKRSLPFKEKIKLSFVGAWGSLRPILIYMFIGIGIGAAIYGYMPSDFILKIAGPDSVFAVPAATLIGIPLYLRVETAIPIVISLIAKGMSVGAAIAFLITGAGVAIPEISLLAGIFKPKLLAVFIAVVIITALITGYIFNIIF
ncbi:MAG: putative permease [Bacteroidetes bacterium ADurb.Bin234]|nr:MAG: putative permease [Bacteroidetes bacterium ADurb.Bin234]